MKYRHAAFTLVELTIALAIAALLTGAAHRIRPASRLLLSLNQS
ncbi:MAG: prepilin-type N-terminal cleavage/methylation domain-containing protein, partial [Ralstonia pickettii]|nr:prepilin-type N-terminal cleavage/methylation domain-containing protein [Ralstonia pickettii]